MSGAVSIVAAALDVLDGIVHRIEDYPAWARLWFLGSSAVVLTAIFVYAALFTTAERRRSEPNGAGPVS